MATFNTSKFIPTELTDLSGVLNDLNNHFAVKGYEIKIEDSSLGSFVSLSKGGIFKMVLGMKTSLNVDIKRLAGGIAVEAKVGIFGQQAIPSLIMWFVAWPVLLTQITGLVQQAKLDDEVLDVIEKSIARHEKTAVKAAEAAVVLPAAVQSGKAFCVACGKSIDADSAFCPACGAKQG